jgi:thioredoxin reductase
MIAIEKDSYEVIIVGGGISGLSAAKRLKDLGVKDLLILEREQECGGAPRHVLNQSFGLFEFRRPMLGPEYARRMREGVRGAEQATGFNVTKLLPEGILEVAGPQGVYTLQGKRVILSTGTRESSRHARMVSGSRPFGVMTFGELERYLHFAKMRPFQRAVIVGTEWISFAAIHTMRKSDIQTVFMLEEYARTTAPEIIAMAHKNIFKTEIYRGVRLRRILGKNRVEGVEVEKNGHVQVFACDGVVFTGKFIPEAHLVQRSCLFFDTQTGGPLTDQYQRLSDPAYFACGNILRPVETSWVCSKEGIQAARFVQKSLSGTLPPNTESVPIRFYDPVRFVWPQHLVFPHQQKHKLCLKVSMRRPIRGILRLVVNGQKIWSKAIKVMPEQIIKITPKGLPLVRPSKIEIICDEL